VLISSVFAGLAQKYSKLNKKGQNTPNIIFWILSMSVLIFVMGFREIGIGVDDFNYLRNYNIANNLDIISYYTQYSSEPGFYLLYRLVDFIFGDFQWLIIITSTLTICLFYSGFKKLNSHTSLAFVIFTFGMTQYFYYFGILKLGLAVSIIVASYNLIYKEKKLKFILLVFIAAMFHYSALFGLIMLFIKKDNKHYNFRTIMFKLFFTIPIAFITLRLLIYPLLVNTKYSDYIENFSIVDISVLLSIPFIFLFLLNYKKLKFDNSKNVFYLLLYVMYIITEMFAPIMGTGRVVWYLKPSLSIMLSATLKVNNSTLEKYVYIIAIILYSLIYAYYAYFGESFRGDYMLPYKNILF
jgi:hypothetical protein